MQIYNYKPALPKKCGNERKISDVFCGNKKNAYLCNAKTSGNCHFIAHAIQTMASAVRSATAVSTRGIQTLNGPIAQLVRAPDS